MDDEFSFKNIGLGYKIALGVLVVVFLAGLVWLLVEVVPDMVTPEPTEETTPETTPETPQAALDTPAPTTEAPASTISAGTVAGTIVGILVIVFSGLFVRNRETGLDPLPDPQNDFEKLEAKYEKGKYEVTHQQLMERFKIKNESTAKVKHLTLELITLNRIRRILRKEEPANENRMAILEWYYRNVMGIKEGEPINLDRVEGERRVK